MLEAVRALRRTVLFSETWRGSRAVKTPKMQRKRAACLKPMATIRTCLVSNAQPRGP